MPDNLGKDHAMTGDRHCIKIEDREISRGARYDAKDNAEWLVEFAMKTPHRRAFKVLLSPDRPGQGRRSPPDEGAVASVPSASTSTLSGLSASHGDLTESQRRHPTSTFEIGDSGT